MQNLFLLQLMFKLRICCWGSSEIPCLWSGWIPMQIPHVNVMCWGSQLFCFVVQCGVYLLAFWLISFASYLMSSSSPPDIFTVLSRVFNFVFDLLGISAKAAWSVFWQGAILINVTLLYKELDSLFYMRTYFYNFLVFF